MSKLEDKIEILLKQMTLEEKVSMLAGADAWKTVGIDRLGIPSITMQDGPNGVRIAVKEIEDKTSFCFPVGICLSSTWNVDLVFKIGESIAEEALHRGMDIILGPNVNIIRSPLNGRNFETYSEDPYHTSRIGVAFIKGVQSRNIGTSIKHYVCNNSEFQRMSISSEVRERALREIYLPAFKAAVEEADPWTVMASYNKINGIFATENYYLLNEILKEEWGYKGYVVSDWGAVHSTVPVGKVGMDLEMPGPAKFLDDKLVKAVNKGEVSQEAIDDKVRRILRIIYKSGSFDNKKIPSNKPLNNPEHAKIAREAASEGMVLLKNQDKILPIEPKQIKKIAIIGPNASKARIQGGGSANVIPYYKISPLEGIKNKLKIINPSAEIVYEQGCKFSEALEVLDSQYLLSSDGKTKGGLTVEFFSNPDLHGVPAVKKIINKMVFGNNEFPSEIDLSNMSFRMSGKLIAPETGNYKFGLTSLGLSRLFINEKSVDNWENQIPGKRFGGLVSQEKIEEIHLESGKEYNIIVEFQSRHPEYGLLKIGFEIPIKDDPLERAVQAATNADHVIVCLGLSSNLESEGFDRPHMNLPELQTELIKKVVSVNENTIVLLNTGSPIDMGDWIDSVKGIIQIWYPGQECGNAIADIIFGDVNPSGKLPETFPMKLEDNPAFINYPGENGKVYYGEDIFVGYRYYDTKMIDPLFPFGFGLSYSEFEYSALKISSLEINEDDELNISVDVKNIGMMQGKEVVQLYIQDEISSLVRPVKELKGFKKVDLKPGENKTVDFKINKNHLSFYDPVKKKWIAEMGVFKIMIGSSSRDIRLKGSFTLVAK